MLPRVMIAAPGSGHGKTTLATGLLGALRAEGLRVAGFKVGPDYIDPGYHALATGRPGRNLDPHLCPAHQITPLLLHGAATPEPADVAVVEGVMGLFDGQIGGDGFASTAHVASLTGTPVILVLDISHVSRTAAAIVHGLHTFDPAVRISGVLLNKAGSPRHAAEIISALEATGLPVLGVLPRDAGIEAPSRHLGLVPAAEREEAAAAIARLAGQVAEHVDLTAVLKIAYAAPLLDGPPWNPYDLVSPPSDRRPVVAVAGGRAFTFRYAETEELLRAAGCEPVVFDPLTDPALPPGTAGLYLGGGFPEVHATGLSANTALRTAIRAAVADGLPTVAECAGLLYLCRRVDGVPLVGAVDAEARMTDRLTLRYRTPVAAADHLLAVAGRRVTGHEFHRTVVEPVSGDQPAWLVDGEPVGFATDTLHASYLHLHWAGHPHLASRFAEAVHAYAATDSVDLGHHGDSDIADHLVDLAVNVRLPAPPDWLAAVINETTAQLGAYPQSDAAVAAIAAAHHVSPESVLPTAGGAEAFTLLARALPPGRSVVVHPQFTEPEAALRAAGQVPQRVLLPSSTGFRLQPEQVPADADLVMIGNPTNPTGTLHSAAAIRSLLRPGRLVVVDEAFMDAVPGEPETMITSEMPGLVVFRSLTKTWGLAGLRAGYAVGDPEVVARLRAQQPPWSVSTPALAAVTACLSDKAREIADAAAEEISANRDYLVAGLADRGLVVAGQPRTPFVLVNAHRADRRPGWLRDALRAEGFAVRRGETFPGLSPDWIRIAVRDRQTTDRLAEALDRIHSRHA
ncbi:MAG TPA: cobyrinate a,c-diamide synthase [Propionibacteriaceae bacterium]|nr:cobyrinate a,c-diamide synthase [Propionibacteriaceae bacterium]